jgi:simple sugar transport system permease protein
MTLAGALAGLAGAGEVLGLNHTLPAAFSSGYGFDAIAVALLAKSHPIGIVPAAFLWGGLRNGAGLMQVHSGVSIDLVYMIQALVIACIAADQIVRWLYRLKPRGPTYAEF